MSKTTSTSRISSKKNYSTRDPPGNKSTLNNKISMSDLTSLELVTKMVHSIEDSNIQNNSSKEAELASDLRKYAHLVFCTGDLLSVYLAAVNESSIGFESFQVEFQRLVLWLGRTHISEYESVEFAYTAELLNSEFVSITMTDLVVDYIRKSLPAYSGERNYLLGDRLLNDSSFNEFGFELALLETSTRITQASMERMRDSLAFAEFKRQLVEFVNKPHSDRISLLFRHGDDSADEAFHNSLIHDIAWVPPGIFKICETKSIDFIDSLQGLVESITRREWDWWPMSPRRVPIPENYSRINWTTVRDLPRQSHYGTDFLFLKPCGVPRWLDIPTKKVARFKSLLQFAPDFLTTVANSCTSAGSATTEGTGYHGKHRAHGHTAHSSAAMPSSSQGSSRGQNHTISLDPAGQPDSSRLPKSHVTRPPALSAQKSNQSPSPRFVYLCVQIGGFYKFFELGSQQLNKDSDFFSSVKRIYLDAKGGSMRWLTWASWWRYDHCEFFQVNYLTF